MKDLIALSTQEICLKRNEFLVIQGSIDTNIYFVVEGSLRIFVLDDGIEQTIRFGYKDNLIVALDSFFTNQPTKFYIQALKKTVVKIITQSQLKSYLDSEQNNKAWTTILENLVVQQLEREIDLLTDSPAIRFERVLKRSPQLFQEIPNRYIANYLRMSPETLSRLKKS